MGPTLVFTQLKTHLSIDFQKLSTKVLKSKIFTVMTTASAITENIGALVRTGHATLASFNI